MSEHLSTCDMCGTYDNNIIDGYECIHGHSICSHCSDIDAPIIEIATTLVKEYLNSDIVAGSEKTYFQNELLFMILNKDKQIAYNLASEFDYEFHVPSKYCSVCNSSISAYGTQYYDILLYLANIFGTSYKELMDSVQSKFKNYGELHEFINDNNKEANEDA